MDFIRLKNRWEIIKALPISVFFNFYYLPFRQAVKLPILLYRPTLFGLKGKIIIKSEKCSFGMIHLGRSHSVLLQKSGIWINIKGTLIFKGNASFGSGSSIQIGENAVLELGNRVTNAIALNIDCRYKITIRDNVGFGWDVIVMDSAMHRLKNIDNHYIGKGYDEIVIGKNNWITTKCIIQAGAKTPDYCILATGSLLNKDLSSEETHVIMAGCPAKVVKRGVWRDFTDCDIIYEVPSIDQ